MCRVWAAVIVVTRADTRTRTHIHTHTHNLTRRHTYMHKQTNTPPTLPNVCRRGLSGFIPVDRLQFLLDGSGEGGGGGGWGKSGWSGTATATESKTGGKSADSAAAVDPLEDLHVKLATALFKRYGSMAKVGVTVRASCECVRRVSRVRRVRAHFGGTLRRQWVWTWKWKGMWMWMWMWKVDVVDVGCWSSSSSAATTTTTWQRDSDSGRALPPTND